jgi:hypothetical protein
MGQAFEGHRRTMGIFNWPMGLMLNTYNCPMGHFKQPMGLVFESRVELHQPTKMVINRNSTTVVVFPKVINRNRNRG